MILSNGNIIVQPMPYQVSIIPQSSQYHILDAVNNAKVLQDGGIFKKGDILQFHNNFQVYVSQNMYYFQGSEIGEENSFFNYWIIPPTPAPYNGIYGYFRGLNTINANLLHDKSYTQDRLLEHFNLLDGIILVKPKKNINKTIEIKERINKLKNKSFLINTDGIPLSQQVRDDLKLSDLEVFDCFGDVIKTCNGAEHLLNKTILISKFRNYDKIGNTVYSPLFIDDIIAIVD